MVNDTFVHISSVFLPFPFGSALYSLSLSLVPLYETFHWNWHSVDYPGYPTCWPQRTFMGALDIWLSWRIWICWLPIMPPFWPSRSWESKEAVTEVPFSRNLLGHSLPWLPCRFSPAGAVALVFLACGFYLRKCCWRPNLCSPSANLTWLLINKLQAPIKSERRITTQAITMLSYMDSETWGTQI